MKGLTAFGWFLFVLAPFALVGPSAGLVLHFGRAPQFVSTAVCWGTILVGVFAGAHVASGVMSTKDPDGTGNMDNDERDDNP